MAAIMELFDRICAEQRNKWLRGERVSVEELADRYPALRSDPETLVDLIYHEYLLREEVGESNCAEEFCARYPEFRQQLSRQFRLHAALESDFSTGWLTGSDDGHADSASAAISLPDALPGQIPGTKRFDIIRRLASGSMGTVYIAYDRHWRQKVAIKCLHRVDAAALYRLKQEFRVAADLDHPNFVQLFELFSLDQVTFFTMELVEGVDFVRYCRSGGEEQGDAAVNSEALRDAMRQLAETLSVLHAGGRMHCDIKPPNVLVSSTGRLVLLDFGLAMDQWQWQTDVPQSYLRGTAAYLAPEQWTGGAQSPAGDWYSVGVMLYQCLTGRLPFDGTVREVIEAKQQSAPPEIGREAPRDLARLCMELLSWEPGERPSGAEVLSRLGGGRREETSLVFEQSPQECFVGRHSELQTLNAAFERVQRGETVRLLVRGASGVGKTAMVNQFLEKLDRRGDVLVLPSRCHEQESVPVKAFDHLMDRLSFQLGTMSRGEIQSLLPPEMGALVRMFPVLRRGGLLKDVEPVEPLAHDPQELRRSAVEAFRILLTRLSQRKTLVLLIDDLHWGDPDSAALLADLLRPGEAPPLLLLGCSRARPGLTDSLLARLEQLAGDDDFWDITLDLEDLPLDQATELAGRHLEDSSLQPAELAARISGGNPFLILELTRFGMPSLAAGEQLVSQHDELADKLLWARASLLAEPIRRVLEVVAVAGEPLDPEAAFQAAHFTGDPQKAWRKLRLGRLVRLEPAGHGKEEIEAYHDRVREAIVRQLPADLLQRHHRNLALALEAAEQPDLERLARHYHAAGSAARAWEYAVRAADQALAFEQAAKLYRLALGTGAGAAGEQADVQQRLADALAHAGRGAEAGPAYLQAADNASGSGRPSSSCGLGASTRASASFKICCKASG